MTIKPDLRKICLLFYSGIALLNASALAQVNDAHSAAQPSVAVVKHLALQVTVNFQKKIISGKATWTIQATSVANEIIFDTRDLSIRKVTLGDEDKPTTFTWGPNTEYLGKALHVKIKPATTTVNIYYSTSPNAAALQWLSPQQTADKQFPFLFTQSEAILARSWIPCQDGPGIRFTYEADVKVPSYLLAVMSASNPQVINDKGRYHFSMTQPIPSYLMALAVGDIRFHSLSENTGVYAEPSMLDKAAWEFADIPEMVAAAERLYGPYQWNRYDVIVLPPSFPFGGMENPRLTFATPTVIAGDRSLVSLICHELAHSWSGNLVTNATWDDFWLNEGFTDYFERRIDEELYGKDFSDMQWLLGIKDLQDALADFGDNSRDTWLKLDLRNRDPGDAMNAIAYEKGALLLRCLETKAGREKFDAFLKSYFSTYAFQSMTTEKFTRYLEKELINKDTALFEGFDYSKWIYGPGIPDSCSAVESSRFQIVNDVIRQYNSGTPVHLLDTKNWVAQQWIYFLQGLPKKLSADQMTELDATFKFTSTGNSEIAVEWFERAISSQYTPAYAAMESFLMSVGRRKFLMPLYEAMMQSEETKPMALTIYRKSRQNYHSIATGSVDEILDWKINGRNAPY
ncbi:MAG: M1 family metallopeptidase [Chitinophagales bacterium]|nr:M1 family metallopeptidase [Chitinophagales bacterium]